GALPFIAYDILRKPVDHAKSFLKVLHHDLESVFWTLYYFALYHGGPDVDKTHQVNWACPSSISASTVTNLKAALLLDRRRWEGDIGGLFGSLKPYFQAFTKYYRIQDFDDKTIDPIIILNLVNNYRNMFEHALASTSAIPSPSSDWQPHKQSPQFE
ncbi:hypothetical protein FRB90_010647, partial [Tulasnella sp. 427]